MSDISKQFENQLAFSRDYFKITYPYKIENVVDGGTWYGLLSVYTPNTLTFMYLSDNISNVAVTKAMTVDVTQAASGDIVITEIYDEQEGEVDAE